MILADEPAYDLPPISRAMKFADFDRLLARLIQNERTDHDHDQEAGDSEDERHQDGAARVPRDEGRPAEVGAGDCAVASGGMHLREPLTDYWNDTATDPGGYHGEIELTPVGAVPVAELEG